MKRRLLPLLAVLTLPVAVGGNVPAAPPRLPAPPREADAAPVVLVVDLSAGQTLYAREAERPFLPASMTKAMTALVAFDLIAAGKLREDTLVTIRPETARRWAGKGTTLSLRGGEQLRLGDLLMGVTTVSANDASVALAETAMGSSEAWIAAMNARARRLGMNGSHFGTPNGWPDRGATHVTARDLVRLAQALIVEHPALYRRYFGHQAMQWRGQRLASHDPFAGVVPGADGIKTGHTFEAGFNFLGAVERQGRRLVVVVAGARTEPARASAARALAEWGYAEWDSRPFVSAGQVVGQARVQDGDARRVPLAVPRRFAISVPKGSHPQVTTRLVYTGPLRAPIARGTHVAGLEVAIAGRPRHYLPLVAARDVGKAGPFDRIVNGLLGLLE